jgi:hypothetical protein
MNVIKSITYSRMAVGGRMGAVCWMQKAECGRQKAECGRQTNARKIKN